MNIFLSAANDWNVIDIRNKFLFVKLEFIAFISLLQNNRAGIPLNLLIKNKKKERKEKKNNNKKHSHKIFFNMHLVTKLTERNRRFTILPPPYSFNPPPIISIHPLSQFSPETWNTCLTSGQIYSSSYISSSNSAYNVFNFPIRDYHSIDSHHPFPLLRSSFPQESHGQLPRGLRLPTFICIKPDRS